jgi:hypothetical protein
MKLAQFGTATLATTLTVIGCLEAQSAQALTVYTNRAAWQNALGGAQITEEFFDTNQPNGSTLSFNGFTSTGNGTGTSINRVLNQSYNGAVDGQGDVSALFDTITWNFSQAITAFGADWVSTTTDDRLTITGNFDGTGNQTIHFSDYPQLGTSGTGFLGIVGNAAFSTLIFSTEAADSSDKFEAFNVDHLSFVQIPTPALLPGLVGMSIAAWRKRQGETVNS